MRKGVAVITPVVVVCARLAVVARARRRRSPWRPDLGHLFRQWCRHRRAVLAPLRRTAARRLCRVRCTKIARRRPTRRGGRINSAATQGVSSRPVRTSLPFGRTLQSPYETLIIELLTDTSLVCLLFGQPYPIAIRLVQIFCSTRPPLVFGLRGSPQSPRRGFAFTQFFSIYTVSFVSYPVCFHRLIHSSRVEPTITILV